MNMKRLFRAAAPQLPTPCNGVSTGSAAAAAPLRPPRLGGEVNAQPAAMPMRVQLRRVRGWRLPPNTVKVCRPGPWRNPFVVGKHGTASGCVELYATMLSGCLCIDVDRACVAAQKRLMEYAAGHIGELRGKNLACWCRIGQPCHADILLRAANNSTRNPLLAVSD
jgi:hypothetical protein